MVRDQLSAQVVHLFAPKLQYFLSFRCILSITRTKQIINLLLLNNFYPVSIVPTSSKRKRRVIGLSSWSAISCQRKRSNLFRVSAELISVIFSGSISYARDFRIYDLHSICQSILFIYFTFTSRYFRLRKLSTNEIFQRLRRPLRKIVRVHPKEATESFTFAIILRVITTRTTIIIAFLDYPVPDTMSSDCFVNGKHRKATGR